MIYDSAHGMGFLHRADTPGGVLPGGPGGAAPPQPGGTALAKTVEVFYRTIAVEGRENPQLRRQLCPKRYWPLMTELGDAS